MTGIDLPDRSRGIAGKDRLGSFGLEWKNQQGQGCGSQGNHGDSEPDKLRKGHALPGIETWVITWNLVKTLQNQQLRSPLARRFRGLVMDPIDGERTPLFTGSASVGLLTENLEGREVS